MQIAATDGMLASPGFGRMPLAHRAATLPGVSEPSSVVRSMHRMARSSGQSFDDFLIERLASDAARSSAPTWSTLRTPRMSEPRCESERAVATRELCDASTLGLDVPAVCRRAQTVARMAARLRSDFPAAQRGRAAYGDVPHVGAGRGP